MTVDEFKETLAAPAPPPMSIPLQALWHDARGEWDKAHEIADDVNETAAWVHAYLHRKEGALDNAKYWYERAHQPIATDSFDDEWVRIVRALLAS